MLNHLHYLTSPPIYENDQYGFILIWSSTVWRASIISLQNTHDHYNSNSYGLFVICHIAVQGLVKLEKQNYLVKIRQR